MFENLVLVQCTFVGIFMGFYNLESNNLFKRTGTTNHGNRNLKYIKTVPEMKIATWNIRTLLPDTRTSAKRP